MKDNVLILNAIKKHYGFKGNTDFAEFLGISPQNLSNWYTRNTFDYDILFTKCEDISSDFLLSGKGSIVKHKEDLHKVEEPLVRYDSMPSVVTVDRFKNDNIVLVSAKAHAGYLKGYTDPEYIAKLPSYYLPGLSNGTFRMFQISGNSMLPNLHDKCYVVGTFVDNWMTGIKDGRVYIVVSNEGLVIKRVINRLNKYGSLYCKSDNRDFPSFSIHLDDIREVWEYQMHLAFEINDPSNVYDRISNIEAEIEYLKENMTKKL